MRVILPAYGRRMGRKRLLTAWLVPIAATLTATSAPAAAARSADAASVGIAGSPVKHVIEIMIENHTFDNLFGRFQGADGIPASASFPNPNGPSAPNVPPVWATPNEGDVLGEIDNSRAAEQAAMDYQPGKGYQMDRYTVIPQDGMSAVTEFDPSFDPDEQYLASAYELADHNFQPVIAPTEPNVLTALNGTSHGWYSKSPPPGPAQPWNSIFDEFTAHHRSWKIYYALPTSVLSGTIWEQIIPSGHTADLTDGNRFFTDLADGTLPDFSFVRPGVGYSSEPPEDIAEADAWIGQLVNAVARSRYWDSTAIFVTYDEGGGFWDHLAPSYASGFGTRTPTIIISPYARRGVFHQQITNVSILSFMQVLWGLPPLTTLNARQDNLLSAFDFGQAPLRAPTLPMAPTVTIGFHGTGGILTDLGPTHSNKSLTINLEAETGGLSLDSTVTGPVRLALTPPPGVPVPPSFPTSATLVNGQADITVKFAAAGYYRIKASGPDGSVGWVTLDVGVNPDTVP
jgi:phospholipase C